MRASPLLLGFMIAVSPALAQGNEGAPVNIEADTNTFDTNQKIITYCGNVIVSQADMRLRANCVRAEIGLGTTINKVVADGGVVVNATTGTITGDAGTYDVGARLITVTGKVVLTSDKNVMRGSLLTYNVTTRQAKFSASGQRVQGLFMPAAGTAP